MSSQIDVVVIDYGVGNILSITNALTTLGYDFVVSNKKEDITRAQALILPGVGAFNEAMQNLQQLNLIELLREEVLLKEKPLLGICLGMQVLAEESEENGIHRGLGLIPGRVIKLEGDDVVRIPHVGWNDVVAWKNSPLFLNMERSPHFYFDHSYHFICDRTIVAGTTLHGQEIVAAVQKGNIFGVQFHPEKSQNNGLRLYRNFFNYIKNYHPQHVKETNHS
ncbi:imidazole glycerol phosphate synthase subunit HisH [Candidatus Woesearchaeota archaeon]|nr:imidazole glycerol phosphate synthase subunit HisH [Candidatus Woesearchaeota archaeon]